MGDIEQKRQYSSIGDFLKNPLNKKKAEIFRKLTTDGSIYLL